MESGNVTVYLSKAQMSKHGHYGNLPTDTAIEDVNPSSFRFNYIIHETFILVHIDGLTTSKTGQFLLKRSSIFRQHCFAIYLKI